MANIFSNLLNRFRQGNKFNQAFMQGWGIGTSNYDLNNSTYLEKGYNFNSVVYSIISKQSIKTASIPFYIKEIKDKEAKNRLNNLILSTKGDLTPLQQVKKRDLEHKAFKTDVLELPLERPNPNQTWSEFNYLYKTFMKLFGNFYVYEVKPENGPNAGTPIAVYLLPPQYVQIVLKKNTDMLDVTENPIEKYILTQGDQYVSFESESVYHVRYPNPNYDENGEHLYGFSPLRSVIRNLQSSNSAIDGNIKILLNNGAFGFIYGKGAVLQEEQVKAIKDRLTEMDNDPARLGKLSALSAEIGFQRISLTTDELKPFDYLDYDQKQICNALGYNDILLNNDTGSKYDNVQQAPKEVMVNDIKPDLQLLEEGFWIPFLAKFPGYERAIVEYDITEMPEMQEDMTQLVEWLMKLQNAGNISRRVTNKVMNMPSDKDDPLLDVLTVENDLLTLEEAIESDFNINTTLD